MSHTQRKTADAAYIGRAKAVLACQEQISKVKKKLHQSQLECARAMHSVSVKTFTFREPNRLIAVNLERPDVKTVNVRKLYVLMAAGEMTLDDFLSLIEAPFEHVKQFLDNQQLSRVVETTEGKLALTVTPQ